MSDEFEKFYEDKESNEDSKSDARVALVLVICFVAAALFWVSRNPKKSCGNKTNYKNQSDPSI